MNKLISQVALPYKSIRGSISDRQRQSIQLVDHLYRDLMPKFKREQLPVEQLQISIDNLLQKRIKIIVKNNTDPEFFGGSDINYSPISDSITATTLEVPIFKKKIHISNLITILHEFQHLSDQLFHPKYLGRNQFMYRNELYSDKYNKLYDNFIYCREYAVTPKEKQQVIKQLEYKIRKFLKGLSPENKVNYLQDTRYTLMMEDQAYHTQRKYAKKLNKKHLPILEEDLDNENKKHMFTEKIELLNKLIMEIIKKERGKHAAKLKKIKVCKDTLTLHQQPFQKQ